ncbi:MAG: hypothetical protein A2017_11255 [Lentisphaerae bacterium GWF2_44_16]|nr:MAG: hypothetical protein A2017_11255 [Lentisphaerae bacterium GWF2_44_16]
MDSKDIKINSAGKVQCGSEWKWKISGTSFPDYDLWCILGGKGKLTVFEGGREYMLSAGDCFILRGKDSYYGITDKKDPLLVIYAHFDFLDTGGRVLRPFNGVPARYRKISNSPFFTGILERMALRFRENRHDSAEIWLKAALAEISYQDFSISSDEAMDENRLFIENIKREIMDYPERRHSLKEIAEKSSYCRDHFSRLFKSATGISFREFLIQTRMEKAKFLLDSSGLSVGKTARLCGYGDIYMFSRQFKTITGKSPTEYRDGKR